MKLWAVRVRHGWLRDRAVLILNSSRAVVGRVRFSRLRNMADQSATPKPRKKRRWFRRILLGLLIILVAIVVFHRPLIHHGGRYLAIWLAKRENVNLDLQI